MWEFRGFCYVMFLIKIMNHCNLLKCFECPKHSCLRQKLCGQHFNQFLELFTFLFLNLPKDGGGRGGLVCKLDKI